MDITKANYIMFLYWIFVDITSEPSKSRSLSSSSSVDNRGDRQALSLIILSLDSFNILDRLPISYDAIDDHGGGEEDYREPGRGQGDNEASHHEAHREQQRREARGDEVQDGTRNLSGVLPVHGPRPHARENGRIIRLHGLSLSNNVMLNFKNPFMCFEKLNL